jgi:hypothetical protein
MGGKTFPPGHFLVELDGVSAGDVKNFQGGGAVAEVIREKPGADHTVRKHIGAVHYDDIVLTCGTGMTKAFYDWVARASTGQGGLKNGAVIVFEGGKEISRLDWIGGQITEIDFPALDATSSDSFSSAIDDWSFDPQDQGRNVLRIDSVQRFLAHVNPTSRKPSRRRYPSSPHSFHVSLRSGCSVSE